MDHVVRYIVTHIGRHGMRVMAHAAQGRNTYATAEAAQAWIDAAMANNSTDSLNQVYGMPLEVRAVPCWPVHFDPKTIYAD